MDQPDNLPVAEPEQTTDEATLEQDNGDAVPEPELDENGEPIAVEEEAEEVDFEGKQYKVPKELKDALLRQSDYTRKTQEVAETRKQIESERQQFAQQAQLQEATLQHRAEVLSIDQQLAQYQGVNWNELSDSDPALAQKLFFQYQGLQEKRQGALQQMSQAQQQVLYSQQQEAAKRLQEGREALAREITGWAEKEDDVVRYAMNNGYSIDDMKMAVSDKRMAKTIWKAFMFDQMQKSATPAKPKAAPAQPVTTVKAKSATAAKDPDKMSSDEWLKWRNNSLRRK